MRTKSWVPILILALAGCSGGGDRLEALIGSEPSLHRLDRQVRWTVAAARDIGSPAASADLEAEQRRWRESLVRCLKDEDPALCVAEAHRERLADLQDRFGLDARRVAVHAAGADGYQFRAVGNEPGWNLLLSADRAIWETDYGQTRHEFLDLRVESGADGRTYTTQLDGVELRIRVEEVPCTDDMSGEIFAWQVVITRGDQTWRGCADRTSAD